MSTVARLMIYATEATRAFAATDAEREYMTVDLADIRAWRFYKAAPQDFLQQYADEFIIFNANMAHDIFEEALRFLDLFPLSTLTLCGRFSRQATQAVCAQGPMHDARVAVKELPATRLMRLVSTHEGDLSFELTRSMPEATRWPVALGWAGLDASVEHSAQAWTQAFRKVLIEDVIPELRIRQKSLFFTFMKALATHTAQGLNWARLGAQCGISAPCARDWTKFLAQIGLIDLIAPLKAPAPRRSKMRPKLYWTAPGLALWLSDSMINPGDDLTQRVFENTCYLAIKTAQRHAQFVHFLDTNGVLVPLITQTRTARGLVRQAYFFESATLTRTDALRYLKSLTKIQLIEPTAHCIVRPAAPGASFACEAISVDS